MAQYRPSGLRLAGQRVRAQVAAIPNKSELTAFVRHYLFVFLIFGIMGSYLSTYYSIRGVPTSQIGLLMAIGPMTSLLVQPLWGILSDRSKDKTRILRIVPLGAALTSMLFLLADGFWGFTAVSLLFMSFNTATMPLSDAYTVNYLTRNSQKFSYIRLCGSSAFALSALGLGRFLSNDLLWLMFPYTAVMYLVVSLNARTLPRLPMERSEQPTRFRDVLKDRTLLLILAFVFFMQMTLAYNMSFLGVYINNLGFSDTNRGLIFSLVAISEIPVLLLIDRTIARFPMFGIMVFSGMVMVVRSLIYAFLPIPGFFVLAQGLNGLTFMPVAYSAITYINNRMPVEYKTSGQSLLALVQFGAGNITGSVLGGVFSGWLGISGGYALFAAILLAATVALFLVTMWMKKERLSRPAAPR